MALAPDAAHVTICPICLRRVRWWQFRITVRAPYEWSRKQVVHEACFRRSFTREYPR